MGGPDDFPRLENKAKELPFFFVRKLDSRLTSLLLRARLTQRVRQSGQWVDCVWPLADAFLHAFGITGVLRTMRLFGWRREDSVAALHMQEQIWSLVVRAGNQTSSPHLACPAPGVSIRSQ